MTIAHLSNRVLTGAVCAALLAGCSAGSQFSPPTGSAGSQAAGFQQADAQPAATVHVAKSGHEAGVSPDWVDWTGAVLIGGKLHYYYINIWNQFMWITSTVKSSGGGSLGGSLAKGSDVEMATTEGTIGVYSDAKLVTTLEGLNGAASAVETDTLGNTFAAVNVSGAPEIQEFAAGSGLQMTYNDPNLASIAGLGIDKTDHIYVEGQSASGTIEVDELSEHGAVQVLAQSGIGATAGGLAVQTLGKITYLWINDLGNASEPANITRYQFTGKSLVKQGSFEYTGVDGAIAVDPTGKDTSHVYAVNNVPAGSEYSVTGIKYAYPSGQIVSQSKAQTASQASLGIMVK
jgi:hypothetical protein